jgi:hypothetical protein
VGSYGGGFRRRRAWIYTPLNGGSADWRWFLARSVGNGCKVRGVKHPKGFGFISQQRLLQRPDGLVSRRLTQRRRLTLQLLLVDTPRLGGSATPIQLPG